MDSKRFMAARSGHVAMSGHRTFRTPLTGIVVFQSNFAEPSKSEAQSKAFMLYLDRSS